MPLRDDIVHLFTLHPSPVRWPIAVQAAVSMALPTVGFTLAGRSDLGLLASAGAFTALYLVSRSRYERIALLPIIMVGLVASSALGVLVSGNPLLSLIALFVVVAVASVLCLGFSIGPPGPMFFALLCGVSSHLAAPESAHGVGIDGGLIVGMLVIGCVIAYLVVLVPLAVPGVRARDAAVHADRRQWRFALDGDTRITILRLLAAVAVAVIVAAPLGIARAYWVVLAVVAILQNGHRLRLNALRGIHRLLGTLVGVGVYAALMLLHPQGLWLALILVVLQFCVELVVVRNYGLALILITPLALLIATQGSADNPGAVAVERALDTLLGAAIALTVLAAAHLLRRDSVPLTGA